MGIKIQTTQNKIDYLRRNNAERKPDNIFASQARSLGMDAFADFLCDDWVPETARNAGFEKFADWLDEGDSNILKEAVKHPIITIAALTAAVFGGTQLYNVIKSKKVNVLKENSSTLKAAVKQESVKTAAEQLAEFNKTIEEGIKYESELGFKNIDILKNATEVRRNKIFAYLKMTNKEKDFLMFASGNKPALIENMGRYTSDMFDCLRSPSVNVAEFILSGEGNLVLNKNAVMQVIKENRQLFAKRMGLPVTAGIDEIYKIISRSYNNPLATPHKYADIRALLQGATKENAYFAQILQDIKNTEKNLRIHHGKQSFVQKSAGGIESFKQALIEALEKSPSYSGYDKSFIEKLKNLINSITNEHYERRFDNPLDFSEVQNTKIKSCKQQGIWPKNLNMQ